MVERIKEYIKIARNTGFFYIMLGNVLCNFFVFLSNIILARIVEKSEYGIYSFANNILAYFLLFSGLGMISGALLLCCESNTDEKKMHAVFSYGVRCGMMINFVMSIIIVFYGCFVKSSIRGTEHYILLMSFLPIVNIALEFAGIYFRSTYKNKEYATIYVLNAVLLFILTAVGAYLAGADGIIIASYISPVLSVAFALMNTGLGKSLRKHQYVLEQKIKKEMWKVSIISMSSNAISQLMHLIDISMIGAYIMDENAVASYRIGMVIPSGLNFIPISVASYMYPYFASNRNDILWKRQKFRFLMFALGAFNLCVSVFLVVAAPVIIKCIFGEQYLDAVTVFRILSVSYFWQGTFRILSVNLLSAHKKLKFCLVANILTGLLNVLGDYLLIPRWGNAGAAVATLIVMIFSGFLLTAYYLYILKKESAME